MLSKFCSVLRVYSAIATTVLLVSLSLTGCAGPGGGTGVDEIPSAQLELPKDLPYDPIMKRSAPSLRHDAFYSVKEVGQNGQSQERFITNGRGFVAYSQEPGSFKRYYLYNFAAHTSLLVDSEEHTLKVVMDSPADEILLAYQLEKDNAKLPAEQRLGEKKIGKYDCVGYSYKVGDGKDAGTREDWFAKGLGLLVSQKFNRSGVITERTLTRYNPFCETTLLRLPQGFTLLK